MNATSSGMSRQLLIPFDFSDSSMLAVRVGFHFARVMDVTPVILHVYPAIWYGDPIFGEYMGAFDPTDEEIQEAIEQRDIRKAAERSFHNFRAKINTMQKNGDLPDVRYSSLLLEGVAEDQILEYCRQNKPRLVVMATRGIDRKEEELIGSVTAEVLDSCRVPVFTIPDNYPEDNRHTMSRFLMFGTLDQYDIMCVERMMMTLDMPEADIWMMPVAHRNMEEAKDKLEALYERLSDAWPGLRFHQVLMEETKITAEIDDFIKENKIDLVIAPNRKSGIFTRLFRPSVAHQCLFALDVPMLALPVSKD